MSCRSTGHGDDLLEEGWGFTPKCMMDDAERFQGCLPLTCACTACGEVLKLTCIILFYFPFYFLFFANVEVFCNTEDLCQEAVFSDNIFQQVTVSTVYSYFCCMLFLRFSVICKKECEVRSVQTMFDASSAGKAGLSCDFCGSQYYGQM